VDSRRYGNRVAGGQGGYEMGEGEEVGLKDLPQAFDSEGSQLKER
jgi:hypothetical protein